MKFLPRVSELAVTEIKPVEIDLVIYKDKPLQESFYWMES